jgi:hypothetical protein
VTYTTIVSAYGDSNCGAVRVPANYTGETLSQSWYLSRSNVPVIFDGCNTTVTLGTNQIFVTADQVSIVSNCPHGLSENGGSAINVVYQGSGTAVRVGKCLDDDPTKCGSGHQYDLRDFYMKGIKIDISGSTANGAIALKMLRTVNYSLEYIGIRLSDYFTNTGMLFDGTSTMAFNGNGTVISPVITGAASASGTIGMQFGALTTLTQIYGGQIDLNASSGSVCLYKTGTTSDTLLLFGLDCEGAATGLMVDTPQSRAVWGYFRCDTGCNAGNVVDFGSQTSSNMIWSSNSVAKVKDAGLANSFQTMSSSSFHDDLWQQIVTPSFWALNDVQTAGSGTVLQFYHAGNAFITTPGSFFFNSSGGHSLFWQNNGSTVATLDGGGNAHFNGNLTVSGVKSFRIDDPLDPEKKYLYHAAVESPDMKNIYDGIVTLGPKGTVVVKLPAYFGALNRDFRYQLTCIGGSAPVYVAREIHNNRFVIAGGRRGLKVSWQVTGIRRDAYATAHPMKVEVEKTAVEPRQLNNSASH